MCFVRKIVQLKGKGGGGHEGGFVKKEREMEVMGKGRVVGRFHLIY